MLKLTHKVKDFEPSVINNDGHNKPITRHNVSFYAKIQSVTNEVQDLDSFKTKRFKQTK